jgi:hypothetical protein
MTDVDDALNTSSPMFSPVSVQADWAELPPGVSVGGVDSLRDLGQQVGPDGYEVEQSFDDGLPDPVTMTSGNAASGNMAMSLVGRPANVADILTGWRTGTSGFGSGTSIPVTLPSGIGSQDYVVVAIVIDNASGVYEANFEPGHPHGWSKLAEQSDGGLTTYVFGRSHWITSPAPDFRALVSGSFSWVAGSIGPGFTAGNSSFVPVRPGKVTSSIETFTGTNHTGPYANLPSRGYLLGVFATANASGPWTVASGGIELVEGGGGVAAVQMIRTDLITLDGDYQFSSNSTGSTNTAMMFNIPLIIRDREAMDALAYFSPFNEASPVVAFDRDTAAVQANVNVVSPNGIFGTTVFKGQMADIELNGRTAEMKAVSKTRIDLDKALTLPPVFGRRQGLTTDWVASWILAQGGQYLGVAPSPQTRWWAPLHGSLAPHMENPLGYSSMLFNDVERSPTGPYGGTPEVINGPFLTGLNAQMTHARTETLFIVTDRAWPKEVPGMQGEFNDLLSLANSKGRMTFWVKGVAWDAAPASLSGDPDDRPFLWNFGNHTGSAVAHIVGARIGSDRKPQIWLDSGITLTGGDIPIDNQWHFCGFVWDYANGLAHFRMDNVYWSLSGFTLSGTPLPATEASWSAQEGHYTFSNVRSRIPIAELQLEAGPNVFAEEWVRFHPTPVAPSFNATYRITGQPLEVLAETVPAQGWGLLQGLAESTLSHLRVNEADNVEMVPLSYFGEAARMAVETYNVLSTDVNAAELSPITLDPSKTRNLAAVEFQETRVDSNRTALLEINSPIRVNRGYTTITFALDVPTAEIHGAVNPYGSTWDLQKLTALQIAGTNPIQNENVMSVAANEDGSSPATGSGSISSNNSLVSARIMTWTTSTVTIRFKNISPWTRWIANNGTDIPFLRILGYAIRQSDAYTSSHDTSSIGARRERALTSQVDWVHHRDVAKQWANTLLTSLSRPRPEVTVSVMGDPRRQPGQLVELTDSLGSRAAGTWRILKVNHRGNGPMFIQELKLARVSPIGIWDESNWDEAVWGE